MKKSPPIVKVFTVVSFLLLIAAFVAYRSGEFNRAENSGSVTKDRAFIDTTTHKQIREDSLGPALSSSKSMEIIEPEEDKSDNARKSFEIMSSSKSMVLIDDAITRQQNFKNDSVLVAKQDSLLEQAKLRELLMGSSKSAHIFVPKEDTSKKKPKK